MTVFDLTQVPNLKLVNLRGGSGLFSSGLVASAQTIIRGGALWVIDYTWTSLRDDDRADLMATFAEVESQSNRLRVPIYDNPKRGIYGGTPLVSGAGQLGSSIFVDNCYLNRTNWIRRGDYFSVIVNGEPELKLCTADASSNGSGEVTILFKPKFRAAPLDNAAIYVEDGILSRPKGIFIVGNSTIGWSSRPGNASKLSSAGLNLVEDVFATQ